MSYWISAVWNRWFAKPLAKVEADSLAYRNSPEGQQFDWKTATVLFTVCLVLTAQNYLASPSIWATPAGWLFGPGAGETLREWTNHQPTRLSWWAGWSIFTYMIIPGLIVRFVFRESVADYGFKLKGILSGWPLYVAFIVLMVPIVWVCSAESRFQATYPFLSVRARSEIDGTFFRWEILYALQFVALEFFFRGFIVHGTKHRFGVYAVGVMTVPYCMIHFGKPMPECLASIVAGVGLGIMSLKTGSIWLGAVLHIGVAWGMDSATLYRRGLIG